MAQSIAVKAKQSVDETVDSYLARIALLLSGSLAVGFAMAGLWLGLNHWSGPIVACFGVAFVFAGFAAYTRSAISSAERRAVSKLEEVEHSLPQMPFDVGMVATYAPIVLPLVARLRRFLPIILVFGLALYAWANVDPEPDAEKSTTE